MIEELATTRRLLLAGDFDGTLAHSVESPDIATPLARAQAALETLANTPGTTVAIISGRRRSELIERFAHRSFILIGEHGADNGTGPWPESDALAAARLLVDELVRTAPGAMAEHKTRSVAFHYRLVEDPDQAVEALRRRASGIQGLRIFEGKKVVELTDSTANIGSALLELKRQVSPDRVVFMGDDAADETAFAVLGPEDVGIHVGVGPSLAGVTVPDTSSLADLLDTLLALRSA
jgi:trehalose-phosphatase